MESKSAVSVTFQVPESITGSGGVDEGGGTGVRVERHPSATAGGLSVLEGSGSTMSPRSPVPTSPRPPRPALRARAFTTGSLWEILSHARAAPAHVTSAHNTGSASRTDCYNVRPMPGGSGNGCSAGGPIHSRLITDYVHMERRHRRRHWSEFDAASGGASPRGSAFSPSPSASISDLKTSASGDILLKPGGGGGRLGGGSGGVSSRSSSPRDVQMRLVCNRGTGTGNHHNQSRNRNSLLASAYISSSLTCLSSAEKRRSASAPTTDTENDLGLEMDDGLDGCSVHPYWRTPQLFCSSGAGGAAAGGIGAMSFLADSMRSISIYRKSSVNSTGSGGGGDDADGLPGGVYGGGREGCLTPSGTFNVSSGSSVSVPSYRLAIICADTDFRSKLIDHFIALGDADLDDDDVFEDDESQEKSAFLTLESEEYYITFTNATPQDVSCLHDVDAWVVVHNTTTALDTTAALLDQMTGHDAITCGIFLRTGNHSSDNAKTEEEQLTTERKLKLLELPALTPAASLMILSRIVFHLQGAERPGTTTPTLPVMRSRRMPGLSFHDVTVDKQTLFNRFFRRTLSTKSCDNLLAL